MKKTVYLKNNTKAHQARKPEEARRERIRTKTRQRWLPFLKYTHLDSSLNRADALFQIRLYLEESLSHPAAQTLIDLFQVQAEELTEIGIDYETIRALEQRNPLLKSLRG